MHVVQCTPMFTNSRSTKGAGEDVLRWAEIQCVKKTMLGKGFQAVMGPV